MQRLPKSSTTYVSMEEKEKERKKRYSSMSFAAIDLEQEIDQLFQLLLLAMTFGWEDLRLPIVPNLRYRFKTT